MSFSYNNPDPSQGSFGGPTSFGGGPYPPSQPTGMGPPLHESPAKPSSRRGCLGCVLGCLVVMVLLAVAAAFATRYFIKQLPDMARQGIRNAVQQSDLSDNDQRVVMQQVDRLVEGYKQGRIDTRQLFEFVENFTQSPLMDLLIAFGAKVQYIDKSGLTPEEKVEAELTLHRFARGAIEKKISRQELDVALNHISNKHGEGARQFKETVSDEELRSFLRECKKLADEAGVPDKEVQVDVGAELKKLVDRTLGELPDETEPTEPGLKAEAEPSSPAGPAPTEK